MSRYESLDVSLNVSRSNHESPRINETIDVASLNQSDNNDERANKFKELYYKNEKLRRDLKALNSRLNERLQKIKLPSLRSKAQSVDLNHVAPSKALQRQLENAYKQVAMYRKQIEVLKTKDESTENYERLKHMENEINYRDIQISHVQEELKSIKIVNKMQSKTIEGDIQNEEMKERMEFLQREAKNLKEKLRDIDRKSRNREQDYKKQQAYLISLETKVRKVGVEENQDEPPPKNAKLPEREITEMEFKIVKDEIHKWKTENDEICKRMNQIKNNLKHLKHERADTQQRTQDKDTLLKNCQLKVESYSRLLKDLESKNPNMVSKIMRTGIIEDDLQDLSTFRPDKPIEGKHTPEISIPASSLFKVDSEPEDREWAGKAHKMSMGYMDASDLLFQESGELLGFRVFMNEDRMICGLIAILKERELKRESGLVGSVGSFEEKWETKSDDELVKVMGSFTQQGYLGELNLISKNGQIGHFGSSYPDSFMFRKEKDQYFSGIFGGARRMGRDYRLTEIGVWMARRK